jgi:hypothetical protein
VGTITKRTLALVAIPQESKEITKKGPRKIKNKAIGSFFSTVPMSESWTMVAGGDVGDYATWFVARMDHHAKIIDLPPQH